MIREETRTQDFTIEPQEQLAGGAGTQGIALLPDDSVLLVNEAANTLEFGGVLINEVPTWRADQMPYGGVKDSGNTKEGPAWSVKEMTEERLIVLQPS